MFACQSSDSEAQDRKTAPFAIRIMALGLSVPSHTHVKPVLLGDKRFHWDTQYAVYALDPCPCEKTLPMQNVRLILALQIHSHGFETGVVCTQTTCSEMGQGCLYLSNDREILQLSTLRG